jgi:hypothetical protein
MRAGNVVGYVADIDGIDQLVRAHDVLDAERVVSALDARRPVETVDPLLPRPLRCGGGGGGGERDPRPGDLKIYRLPMFAWTKRRLTFQNEIEQSVGFWDNAITHAAANMDEAPGMGTDFAQLSQELRATCMDEVQFPRCRGSEWSARIDELRASLVTDTKSAAEFAQLVTEIRDKIERGLTPTRSTPRPPARRADRSAR